MFNKIVLSLKYKITLNQTMFDKILFSVFHAKALYYQETLCRKEDIQKFLSSLVSKKPEVGHLVKCFHVSKSADAKTNSGKTSKYFNSIFELCSLVFIIWILCNLKVILQTLSTIRTIQFIPIRKLTFWRYTGVFLTSCNL